MARPLKWARDLHLLRERASRSRSDTWVRHEVEALFGVGRATALSLMNAIGESRPSPARTWCSALPCWCS